MVHNLDKHNTTISCGIQNLFISVWYEKYSTCWRDKKRTLSKRTLYLLWEYCVLLPAARRTLTTNLYLIKLILSRHVVLKDRSLVEVIKCEAWYAREHCITWCVLYALTPHTYIRFMKRRCEVYFILFFTHLKLCLATAIHNFKWVKWGHICLIWD